MPSRVSLPDSLSEKPFSYGVGLHAGVTDRRMRGSDLSAPFRGTRDPRREETVDGLCRTYATQMGENCFFSSITAAQLMGIPLPARLDKIGAIHVAIVSPHRGPRGVRVIGHKVQLMGGDTWTRSGLVLSTPARTWCELGVLLSVAELVAAGDYIIHWKTPFASHVDLMDAVKLYPDRRGKRKLRAALPLLNERSESPMESILRTILTLGGIAGIEANFPVRASGHNYRIDVAIPSRKLAIEYQSDYHRDPEQWRRDMTRRSRIESEGWTFIEVNANDIRDPTELIARTKAFLR